MSKAEQILAFIKNAIAAQGVFIERNAPEPVEVGDGGFVILRDGDPGDPERFIGADVSYYTHAIEIEIFVQSSSGQARDEQFDALLGLVSSALYEDRTFGGLVNGFLTSRPEVITIPVDAGESIKAGLLVLNVEYSVNNPLQ